MHKNFWIWYPGDFELYHGMKQNFSRVERGYGWPAFWKSEGFRNRVVFRRTYHLEEETSFCVYSDAIGYVLAGERKYPFGKEITCGPGEVRICVHAACVEKFPSIYIEGEIIFSDEGWMAEDYDLPPVSAGCSRYFIQKEQNPAQWEYAEKEYFPIETEAVNGGVLYIFETELTAVLKVEYKKGFRPLEIFCGESREEALDTVHCYYSWVPDEKTGACPCCALQFAFVPGISEEDISLVAVHQYVDILTRAEFHCEDELLNRIWKVSEHTFKLCSGIFFVDGVKRDRWIWSGDAYQSFFVNEYLMADPDINRRTLLALRGNEHMTTHINTIVDYSLLWLLGVDVHYRAYNDCDFVRQIYRKICALMEFCLGQLDENGFLVGREGDWIYIDWAEFDKTGTFCPEQMLLAKCYEVMIGFSELMGEDSGVWRERFKQLKEKIQAFFWDEEQHAFIDSFASGKKNVTRHANIFAILFDIAKDEQKQDILEHVLHNPNVPEITTPYFKFYELDALCEMGCLQEVLEVIKTYWGGMLKRGAVTFWEEYDPNVPREEQYDMYGDRFGKSLCHAWAASPIYLLGKYFLGIRYEKPGYETYKLEVKTEFFKELSCKVPVNGKTVEIRYHDGVLQTCEHQEG